MGNADRTRRLFLMIVAAAVLVVVAVYIYKLITDGPTDGDPTRVPPAPTSVVEVRPTGPLSILFWTNDTKADWVRRVTELFNAQQHETASGRVIQVEVQQGDSPDALQEMKAGTLQPAVFSPGDTSWVNQANEEWEALYGRPLVTEECPTLVYTGIGFSMWRPMAEALGWPNPIGWEDIVDLASDPEGWASYGHPEWGQFKFGHTNPGSSNTGLLAMTSFAYGAAGVREGLTPALVYADRVREAFRDVELHTFHYGTSTRALCEAMAAHGPGYLHAFTSSEINSLACNHFQGEVEPNLRFPLVFIAPKEGIFWSDNPYCTVDAAWVDDEAREAAAVYRDYLLGAEAQNIAIDEWLRPGDRSIPLRAPIDIAHGVDPSVTVETTPSLPSVSGATTNAIIDLFYQTKRPATVIMLLDASQSMAGEKLNRALSGAQSFIGYLQPDDEILVYRFNDDIARLEPSGRVGEVGEELRATISGLYAEGNTVLYDAVCAGLETLQSMKAADEDADEPRLYGIVLLSDGEDTSSEHALSEMMSICIPTREATTGIKLFTIAYGEDADDDLMLRIANRTNASSYVADPETIEAIYERIAFEQ